jgi:FtsP/CotA-like multicopper oxidase with cupredoxin domain
MKRSPAGGAVTALLVSLAGFSAPVLHAQGRSAGGHPLDITNLEVAAFEDYRTSAGRLVNDTLRIALETRAAAWHPWGPDGQGLRAHIFVEESERPRIPGPMIRVRTGTPVQVRVRTTFPDTLLVRGLVDRGQHGGGALGPFSRGALVVPPGSAEELHFTPTVPGTYFYFGRVLAAGWSAGPPPGLPAQGIDRALVGVLIVDPPDTSPPPDERIFLISHWADPGVAGSALPATRFMINGRSWPHTERLAYAQDDTVRWRVINQSGREHPMHLHGFYFRVEARGDQSGEFTAGEGAPHLAVTETLFPAETMRLTWVPTQPGNWLFHCHFMRHMSWLQTAPVGEIPGSHPPPGTAGEDLMGGLVMGISVRPRAGPMVEDPDVRRRLALHIGMRPGVFGEAPGYGFILQQGTTPPAPDSVRFPGSPIIVTRDEPVEITVHNHADVPLGVHWHGLELESWTDGVPGWSGPPDAVRPAIAPGGSFAVRMTPPRAGTFMYHVHSEPGHQLAQGLSGAFVVLEPGQAWEPETDLLFLLGSLGSGIDPPAAINGQRRPDPIELRSGRTYRLRFMHISPDDDKRVRLLVGDDPVIWRRIAKDGADLPDGQVEDGPAELRIHVGETYDFLWTPSAGEYTLRVLTTFDRGAPAFRRDAPAPQTQDLLVRVR